jgi:hypothetical protein
MQDIKEYIAYDQETGIFTWVKPPSKKIIVGSIVGTKHSAGYIQIGYRGRLYKAHRLAWWFTYSVLPDCAIDHINEIRDDNRICNLRLDTNRENEQNNSKIPCNNKSGYRGVSWHKNAKKWVANIRVKNKLIYLGSYDTPEEAHEAYLCAKRTYHPFWVKKNKYKSIAYT